MSVVNEFPEDLYDAMREFVRTHPQWDQYRLMQACLAGFLFQHGSKDRAVSRHYLNGLFHREETRPSPPATLPSPEAKPAPPMLRKLPQAQRLTQERSWPAPRQEPLESALPLRSAPSSGNGCSSPATGSGSKARL